MAKNYKVGDKEMIEVNELQLLDGTPVKAKLIWLQSANFGQGKYVYGLISPNPCTDPSYPDQTEAITDWINAELKPETMKKRGFQEVAVQVLGTYRKYTKRSYGKNGQVVSSTTAHKFFQDEKFSSDPAYCVINEDNTISRVDKNHPAKRHTRCDWNGCKFGIKPIVPQWKTDHKNLYLSELLKWDGYKSCGKDGRSHLRELIGSRNATLNAGHGLPQPRGEGPWGEAYDILVHIEKPNYLEALDEVQL